MIRCITFSDEKMTQSAELCCRSALKFGCDEARQFNKSTIEGYFTNFNKDIFSNERGCGFWLWKPYLIEVSMRDMNEGDILIYADAGIEFVNSVHHIIDKMDEDIFFFTNGWPHVEWCKMDVINGVLGWQDRYDHGDPYIKDKMASYKQVQASVIFFKVNQKTKDFVKEWLLYCQMPGFIDDSPSKLPNYPTFAEHRHDQAILTCLQIKYGYKLHFWPTNYSEHIRHTARPEDTYPTIFNHHRKRNRSFGKGDSEW